MQLVTVDLLTDVCELSALPAVVALLVGGVLWLAGWWSHRFWVVLAITVLAGTYGLNQAPALHAPALPTAILMALSAGILGLALIRVVAFVAAGLALVLLTQEFWPGLNQPMLVFLASGLVCLFLFRLCLTALTATVGAVLMMYATLALVGRYGGQDAVALLERAPSLYNGAAWLLALVGFSIQVYWHRRAAQRQQEDEEGGGALGFPRLWQWMGGGERDAA
jgi:hypothetical protein